MITALENETCFSTVLLIMGVWPIGCSTIAESLAWSTFKSLY